jgi:hypothetical protein
MTEYFNEPTEESSKPLVNSQPTRYFYNSDNYQISQNYIVRYQITPIKITIQPSIECKLPALFLFISLLPVGIPIALATFVKNKKPSHFFLGNPAIF